MSIRCTISNIDDCCLSYLNGMIAGMGASNVQMADEQICFVCDNTNVALLVDLHQRDIIRCDISYGRIINEK